MGHGPYGERVILDVGGGYFSGSRLHGKLLPSGADWFLMRPDGYGVLDVRLTLETHDHAFIYVKYHGIIDLSAEVQASLEKTDRTTQFGQIHFVTQLQFETGDPRYAWLNSTLAIGEGRMIQNAKQAEHKFYEIISKT